MLEPIGNEHFQKFNRMTRKEGRKRKRPRTNKHHMTNACKGGKTIPSNLLTMKIERHSALHRVFRNMSWEEIGDALYSIFGQRDPCPMPRNCATCLTDEREGSVMPVIGSTYEVCLKHGLTKFIIIDSCTNATTKCCEKCLVEILERDND